MTLGALSSDGSMMIVKPLVYVDTSVAKCETTTSGEKSVRSAISSVRISDDRRSAAKLRRWFKEKISPFKFQRFDEQKAHIHLKSYRNMFGISNL